MKKQILSMLIIAILTATSAFADYPEKDVHGIIQWAAGGSTDTVMRSVTPHAEAVLGEDIIMQNKPGGVGAIAVKYTASKPADGYTLLMGAENPMLYKVMGLGNTDYSEFIPINILARGVPLLVANNDVPYNNFKEMIAYIKNNPNKVKFGSTGPGGLASVVSAMLSTQVKIPVISVPYDGDGPALTALQSGAIDVMPAVLGAAIEAVKAGRIKVIALVDSKENSALKGVAPITDEYPAYKPYLPWGPFFGVFVKKGTADNIVAKLQHAYKEGVKNPQFQKLMADRGFKIMNISGDEATKFLTKWQSVTSWIVWDAGIAKHSPEKFGISKP